ncbi:hypothetical protein [Pseudomonas phage BL1]|nr:hypothetical protein [Pseudomonas phage BL1]
MIVSNPTNGSAKVLPRFHLWSIFNPSKRTFQTGESI